MSTNISSNGHALPELAFPSSASQSGKSSADSLDSKKPDSGRFDHHLRRAGEKKDPNHSDKTAVASESESRSSADSESTKSDYDTPTGEDQGASQDSTHPRADQTDNETQPRENGAEDSLSDLTEDTLDVQAAALAAAEQFPQNHFVEGQESSPQVALDNEGLNSVPDAVSHSEQVEGEITLDGTQASKQGEDNLQQGRTDAVEDNASLLGKQENQLPEEQSPEAANSDQREGQSHSKTDSVVNDQDQSVEGQSNLTSQNQQNEQDQTALAQNETSDSKNSTSETQNSAAQENATRNQESSSGATDSQESQVATAGASNTSSRSESPRNKKNAGETSQTTEPVAANVTSPTAESLEATEKKPEVKAIKSTGETKQNPSDGSSKPETTSPRNLGASPTAESLNSPPAEETVSPSDRVRFVQRVAQAIRVQAPQGGSLRLRLSPPELGSLNIEITMQDNSLTARLETETQTARAAVLDNLPALRERLAEQNIKVEQFDVDVRDESQSRHDQTETNSQKEHNQHEHRHRTSTQGNSGQSLEPSENSANTEAPENLELNNQLNIVV